MTKDETGRFLDELVTLYPNSIRKDSNLKLMLKLWEEALKDCSFTDVHQALQAYFKTDTKGYVPTAGQLIDLFEDESDPLKPDDHVFLGW